MDYESRERILQIVRRIGMEYDPSLNGTEFVIKEIPCDIPGNCPLGWYYGNDVVVLPPDFKDEVVLHEIGHRHCDYYHKDTSEEYAEAFRLHFSR